MKETKEMNKEVIELTESEIKERLESFSFEELFEVHQYLSGMGDDFTWYYTYPEFLELQCLDDICEFMKEIRSQYVDIHEEYVYYPYYGAWLHSISAEDLEEELENKIERMAEYIFHCQEYDDENASELIEKALK